MRLKALIGRGQLFDMHIRPGRRDVAAPLYGLERLEKPGFQEFTQFCRGLELRDGI